jgi:hypothetical protein
VPGTMLLKLGYDEVLSDIAFISLRLYATGHGPVLLRQANHGNPGMAVQVNPRLIPG